MSKILVSLKSINLLRYEHLELFKSSLMMKYVAIANGYNVSALTLMGVEAYHNFSGLVLVLLRDRSYQSVESVEVGCKIFFSL